MRLSLHAHSVWPVSIEFDVLSAYTAGFSVEETVEHISTIHALWSSGSDKKGANNPSVSSAFNCSLTERFEYWRLLEDGLPLCSNIFAFGDCARAETGMTAHATGIKKTEEGETNVNETENNEFMNRRSETSRRRNFLNSPTLAFWREQQQTLSFEAVNNGPYFREEVEEQFNFFDMLRENFLSTPYAFLSSYAIPITLNDRRRVVELFYYVDEEVLKAFFGERMHKLGLEGESEGHFFRTSHRRRSQKLQKLIQAGVKEGSLKRQWENLKWVSTFLVSAYRGRDGVLIPYTTPLLKALEQCFALHGELAVRYSTFVFGFEHRLTGRFWEKLSYSECTTVSSALASMWCDDSQLILRESFCTVCTRIARLLDENRVVTEMHQLAFGEAMRPRWQVQLDEMQRAISSNTGVGAGGGPNMSTLVGTALPSSTKGVSHALLRRNTSTRTLDCYTHTGSQPTSTTAPLPNLQYLTTGLSQQSVASPVVSVVTCLPNVNSPATTTAAPNNNNNNSCQSNPGVGDSQNSTSHHPSLSANGVFTRRFLFEFPFIIKCMVRVATTIGNFGRLQEALELFYTRVYLYLENLSFRSPHTPNVDTSNSPREMRSTPSECLEEREGIRDHWSGASRREVAANLVAGEGKVDPNSNFSKSNRLAYEEKLGTMTGVLNNAMVNTSLVAYGPRLGSQRLSTPASPHQTQLNNQKITSFSVGASNGQMYLCELCMLLNLLPNIFNTLTVLTEEDHAVCDSDFSNFILALKFLIQVHMASDDH